MKGTKDLKTRPQCGLVLENKKGKILLQLRDKKSYIPYPDCYGTFGGEIEESETAYDAIIREIKEEIDYELVNPEYIGNFPFHGYNIYMFRKVDFLVVLKDLTVKEGQRAEFLSLEEIRSLKCAFNCREIVEAYFEKYHSEESVNTE